MKTLGLLIVLLTLLPASIARNCITVTGLVVDAESGEPIRNCYVFLKGTDYVAQTDIYGAFLVRVPNRYCKCILVIWENGYDKFLMPVEKLNGEDIKVSLNKIPIHRQEDNLWPENLEFQENEQEFGILSGLKRKSRYNTVH